MNHFMSHNGQSTMCSEPVNGDATETDGMFGGEPVVRNVNDVTCPACASEAANCNCGTGCGYRACPFTVAA